MKKTRPLLESSRLQVPVIRIDNDRWLSAWPLTEARPDYEVAIEACYGWVRHERHM